MEEERVHYQFIFPKLEHANYSKRFGRYMHAKHRNVIFPFLFKLLSIRSADNTSFFQI